MKREYITTFWCGSPVRLDIYLQKNILGKNINPLGDIIFLQKKFENPKEFSTNSKEVMFSVEEMYFLHELD